MCVQWNNRGIFRGFISYNISPQVSEAIVYAILTRPNVIRKDPHYTFALIEADKDDNKFVDCAIAANAKCIATEDKRFKVLIFS